jgi:hypothetical protein
MEKNDFFDSFKPKSKLKHTTRVVHHRKEPYDIYIGRLPGGKFNKWAYPKELRESLPKNASRKEIIDAYEKYLLSNEELMKDLHELKGKILGCWCKNKTDENGKTTGKSCHGDILKKYADKL